MAFVKALGSAHDPTISGEEGACMVISARILQAGRPGAVSGLRPQGDLRPPQKAAEVRINLRWERREGADDRVAKVRAAGSTTSDGPEDPGFMHSHGFIALDGRGWGLFHKPAGADPGRWQGHPGKGRSSRHLTTRGFAGPSVHPWA